MDDRHFGYITKLNPKKKYHWSLRIQMVGRKGWKENITTNRQFCRLYNDTYAWRPPQTGFLCCCPVPVPVEQIVHNFCLRFARSPRSAPRDAERQLSFPPTPVKAPHCRVRSDNKIKWPDFFSSFLLLKTKFYWFTVSYYLLASYLVIAVSFLGGY